MPIQFLGIGAQKAGTSWLFANLRHHPSLFLPEGKKLHFFDKGHISQGIERYLANFAPGEGRICGEITEEEYCKHLILPIFREIFEPRIKRLSFYLNIDLSRWLEPMQRKTP
jgi:hypothetical protein